MNSQNKKSHKSTDFLKSLNFDKMFKESPKFGVNQSYFMDKMVEGTGGTLRISGYFPIEITGIKFQKSPYYIGKIQTFGKNEILSNRDIALDMGKNTEIYDTLEEAIEECKLRNRGKQSPGVCHTINIEAGLQSKDSKYFSPDFL